jgi:Fe-S cluster assembly protein SufD
MGPRGGERMSVVSLEARELRETVAVLSKTSAAETRQRAMDQFLARGFPTTQDEDWKYTDLTSVVDISERWLADAAVTGGESLNEAQIQEITSAVEAHWLVFENGYLNKGLSDTFAGLEISIASIDGGDTDLDMDDPLSDLSAALMTDGVSIQISEKARVDKPVGLLFADRATSGPQLTQARVHIHLGAGSAARFVEYHVSDGDQDHYSNVFVELSVSDDASVDYVRVQNRGNSHSQTQRLNVQLLECSTLRHFGLDIGGALARNDLKIDIAGENASAEFNGLYIGAEKQHIDNHTRVDHRVGPATSTQEYRGILSGRSRCVWNGKAIVHKGADGTDARQANHNLLLAEHCEINAKPELEIYADEVKCAHGTTVGQLDEAALFYLRSRGLDQKHAKRILTRAFATSVLLQSPIPELHDFITAQVEQRLTEIGSGDPE